MPLPTIISHLLAWSVESVNDAVLITSPDLDLPGPSIEYANPAFLEMTGYTLDEVIGKTPRILQGPRTDRALMERLRNDLETRQTFFGETINYRKDGSEYQVEWKISPLRNESGNIHKWVAVQRDVTERHRIENLKIDFLSTLAHELRTPMTAVLGWAQILKTPGVSEAEIHEAADVILRNTRTQTRLIDELLDTSRITSGKLAIEPQRVDLCPIVRAAVDAALPGASEKQIQIACTATTDPLCIHADPIRLQQILGNLLGNAIKFTPNGRRIAATARSEDGHAVLEIQDTGIGIESNHIQNIFERFYQSDTSTTRENKGLGLGLSICKHLVERQRGRIEAESAGIGHGSTFRVIFPLCGDALPTLAPDASMHLAPAWSAPDLSGLRILVVDDDPDMLAVITMTLKNRGATVSGVASARAALEHDFFQFHVLVSDIAMPDMDGFSLIRAVRRRSREQGSGIPAVALTAFRRSDDRRDSMVAGFDVFLSKPFDAAELVAVVHRCAQRGV